MLNSRLQSLSWSGLGLVQPISPAFVPYSQASAELQALIKAIAESSGRDEEEQIVREEAGRLRAELAEPQPPSGGALAELVVRALYCEMFGEPTPFAIIPAITLAQHAHRSSPSDGDASAAAAFTACARTA